jgi:hypothetical protein
LVDPPGHDRRVGAGGEGGPVAIEAAAASANRRGRWRPCSPPHRLVLEITESVLMDSTDANRGLLADLKARGVALAIDDFGTGWPHGDAGTPLAG